MARWFSFPNPVNEYAARTVAAGVLLMTVGTIVLSLTLGGGWLALAIVITYGFAARVAAGPRLSPLGQLATRVVTPRLGRTRLVAGPPKRFAQLLGAVLSSTAVVLHFGFGFDGAAQIVLGLIAVAATLESVFAICLGCIAFSMLMQAGVIPESTCEACANISLRSPVIA